MAERLQKLMETHQDPSGPVPVLVADEIMSLSVLTHLAEKSTLVFPLSTKYNIRNLENRRDAPEYRLGLAIDRGARELSDYLEEALRFYLLTDTETIASAYARLFDELTKFVLAAISPQDFGLLDRPRESSNLTRYRLARDFSRYVLRLDREEIEAYKDHYLPWSNVLRRAYQLVCEAQARDRLRIRQHVEDTLRETVGAGFGHRPNVPGAELRLVRTLLEEDFDVRLAEEDDSSQSLESIVSRVQTALLGSTSSTSQGVPIIAAGPEHLSSVLDLFSQFEKEMRNRRTSTGAIPGADELKNLLSAEGSDAFILLAVLHGQFIGCVQVAPFEGQTARLTRLFVRQRWREPRVAAALVWRAIEYAARHEGYSRVVIRETQTPGKVLEIFKRHGFQVAGDNADLLEYPLQQSPEREPPFETHPAEPG
jgi:GNAT superfamily N-acetyltransferase